MLKKAEKGGNQAGPEGMKMNGDLDGCHINHGACNTHNAAISPTCGGTT